MKSAKPTQKIATDTDKDAKKELRESVSTRFAFPADWLMVLTSSLELSIAARENGSVMSLELLQSALLLVALEDCADRNIKLPHRPYRVSNLRKVRFPQDLTVSLIQWR
jgi:hypothetical protein